MHDIAVGLASILVLGIAAQWAAERLKLPSILLLLGVGVIAGPITGFLDPDSLLGDLLAPAVSLAVGIILLEGGLTLRVRQLREAGRAVWWLVTAGVAISWVITALSARWILGMPTPMAVLVGAILVVTGPTVVIPLLRQLGPTRRVRDVLTWESIFIDPVGAMLAVIVFDAVLVGGFGRPFVDIGGFLLTGTLIGLAVAALMVLLLGRFWVPDFLRTGVTLAMALLAFTLANEISPESGLLATTILGVALANQPWTPVSDIARFSENLQVLLLAALFIVLSARLTLSDITDLGWPIAAFIAVLVVVGRPLTVFVSTWGSALERNEKVFLSLMAPRGIVAASIASVFAIQLGAENIPGSDKLVPVVFATIIVTVAIYGLSARWTGRMLGVAEPNPQGLLMVGGDDVTIALASAVAAAGQKVRVVASNRGDHYRSRMAELDVFYGNVLGSHDTDDIIPAGIGQALALTPNDEFNALTAVHLADIFGPRRVYQLSPERVDRGATHDTEGLLRGRWLFSHDLSHGELRRRLSDGWEIKSTRITEEFDAEQFRRTHGEEATPLFTINGSNTLTVVTADATPALTPGTTVLALVPPS